MILDWEQVLKGEREGGKGEERGEVAREKARRDQKVGKQVTNFVFPVLSTNLATSFC